MIDKSVMKRLITQVCTEINPTSVSPLNPQGDYYTVTPEELLAFANAIAAHQREIDETLCKEEADKAYKLKGTRDWSSYIEGMGDGADECYEAIRKQGA